MAQRRSKNWGSEMAYYSLSTLTSQIYAVPSSRM